MMTLARISLRFSIWMMLIIAALSLSTPRAVAHELRPTIVDVVLGEGGAVALSLSANAEAMLAGIGPEHDDTDDAPEAVRYDALRAAEPEALAADLRAFAPRLIDGIALEMGGEAVPLTLDGIDVPPVGDTSRARNTTIRLTGIRPTGEDAPGEALDWRFAPEFGASVLRLIRAGEGEPFDSAYAVPGDTVTLATGAGAVPRGAMQTLIEYIPIGFDHIVPKGLDHILFVIGLFLLSTRLGPLLWQVTTFTLAHSVTLALAALGLVTVSPAIVEPLIAASIVFIAVENMLTDRLHKWRLLTVFVFGLLHGLGFAGVLAEFGLPADQFVAGLIGFNIGVEVGQLAVIAACFLLVGFWFADKPWYRRFIVFPVSAVIALIAAYWFVQRIGLLG